MRLPRKHKLIFSLLTLCLVLIFTIVTGKNAEEFLDKITISPTQPAVQGITTGKSEATVVRVVDGDTLNVMLHNREEKIRVIGINTPESVVPSRGVQCFGKEASSFAKKTLSGQTVLLETDPTQTNKDRYGRLLRSVWFNNGSTSFGKLMLSEGYAVEYTYETPHLYQSEYRQAEQLARENKKGLWGDDACAAKFTH